MYPKLYQLCPNTKLPDKVSFTPRALIMMICRVTLILSHLASVLLLNLSVSVIKEVYDDVDFVRNGVYYAKQFLLAKCTTSVTKAFLLGNDQRHQKH